MNAPARTTAAFVVFGLLLFIAAAPAQKDKNARRDQEHEYLLGQARTAMLMLPRTGQWNSADPGDQGLLLRALLASGIPRDDERVRTAFQRWQALDLTGDLLAQSERVWLLALTRPDDATDELRRLVDEVCKAQDADGGFAAKARGKAGAVDRVLVTGRVLEALAAAEHLRVPAAAKAWLAASGFLIASQGSDGGFPAGERRTYGAATARGLAALLAAAARVQDGERRALALQAAARAEKWLAQAYRPDRNPGAQYGTYEWLGALEPVMARAWLLRAEEHAVAEEVFRFLQGAQLKATGWNEESLEALASRPSHGGGGGRSGTPLVAGTDADISDTAWAALFLARPTRLLPQDQAIAAAHRLAALARPGTRAEDGDDFVERARLAAATVLPALVDGLLADAVLARRAANGALHVRSGLDMGFVPSANAAANAAAIARWREWARIK